MKYLLFCKNLIFWNIYFFETFIITLFTFLLCNHISPIFIVCIYQILNFKSDSCLQIFIISLFYKILTYFITIFKINIFVFCTHIINGLAQTRKVVVHFALLVKILPSKLRFLLSDVTTGLVVGRGKVAPGKFNFPTRLILFLRCG